MKTEEANVNSEDAPATEEEELIEQIALFGSALKEEHWKKDNKFVNQLKFFWRKKAKEFYETALRAHVQKEVKEAGVNSVCKKHGNDLTLCFECEQQAVEKALTCGCGKSVKNDAGVIAICGDCILKDEKTVADIAVEKALSGEVEQRIGNREILAFEKGLAEHTSDEKKAVEKAVRATLAIPSGRLLDNDLAQACEQIAENEKHGVGAKFKEGEFCAYDYLMDKAKKLREGVEKHD